MNRAERHPFRALVLGDDTRSFLSVVRSLGKAGYDVHVVCFDRTSPALASKYITTAKFYNYQAYSQQEWQDAVFRLIERYQFDIVLPCDERAMYPLWQNREKLPAHTRLAVANEQAMEVLFDKWKTKQAALECGVPVAKGKLVNLADSSYQALAEEFGERFVIKPLQSFKEQALSRRQNVAIVSNCKEFGQLAAGSEPVMVEAFFAGFGEGVSVLSVNGKVHSAFSHRRAAEPERGGGSSYRVSIATDPEQLAAVEAMCQATQFTGVAMFEFRRGLPEKQEQPSAWILVEVNARFWGSLPLAVFCGMDFPAWYANYLMMGTLPSDDQTHYRSGYYARALTADLYELRREMASCHGKTRLLKKLFSRLADGHRLLLGKEKIDSFSLTDPLPFVREGVKIGAELAAAVTRRFPVLLKGRCLITRYRLKKLFRSNPHRRILFVCYGNIMRSPFAEQVCRQAVEQLNTGSGVESFGFHTPEDRQSPAEARQAALQLNYNLEDHRSKCLRQCDLEDSDVVFIFDEKNHAVITASYHVPNAFYLSDLQPFWNRTAGEVADPYGLGLEGVRNCYRQIEQCISRLSKDIISKGGAYER
ncbi:arsenate reductase/protein-tyrosine-phosphatase family protein [Photobacterium ganghwense]|uniref:protein-tyrosine-phosphatase n=1 Tax=Photobacterium ganghwense TaxID=320778 RepID=A0A0J1HGY7_9GAMM|nr:hypothetical protein [Photobacterium ganghwense]KLV10868.1 hypothetical protein ABT57_05350 [Photobacterium ganghwense]MBV1842053.1 hypothetical protein [Photobacterium ganghwense]PSU10956.1 hypothetical protein C9I92_02255 [Photobacterium ganghwense]QSV13062.1 hypothetical protein FH974_09875 [Photobacterium ganghwense]